MTHSALIPSVGVVIATRNRPLELQRVIAALAKQSLIPDQIVVCDSSDEEYRTQVRQMLKSTVLNIQLVETNHRSLTIQRNLALDLILESVSLSFIQILDDDTSPDIDHLRNLSNVLIQNPDVIGVSGVTIPLWTPNSRNGFISLVLRICGLDSKHNGIVTAAGVGIPVHTGSSTVQRSEWIFGCSMWRTKIFGLNRYCSDFLGSSLCEDVEFSTRAAKIGKLLVVPTAHLYHSSAVEGRPDPFLHSYRFTRNRIKVIRNVKHWNSWPSYCLSLFMLTIKEIPKGRAGLPSIRGTLRGINDEIQRKPLR
jgi:glycosyltransferase involved in cell wall biosynthesis